MADIIINGGVIKDIDLFVFDKDGTLIDLYNYWYHMIELRAERISSFYNLPYQDHKNKLMYEMGIDVRNSRLRPEGPVGLLPREIVQQAAENYLIKVGCQYVSGSCFQIFKEVDELSLSLLDKFIRPVKGAIGLLRQIKNRNGKTAIATTDKTKRAELAVKFLNIDGLIDIVVGADKTENPKPAPDMLELIAKSLNTDPINSVMIGDAKTDIQMGINANFKASIAVCSGLTGKDVLSKLTPYVIDDISKMYVE